MPSADVRWPVPLTRLPTLMPGQPPGVEGTGHVTGLRLHTTGKILWVDPNYPGASDQRDGTEPTDPFQTVAAALTHCRDYHGDVVAIMANDAWIYGEGADQVLPIQEAVVVTVHGVRIVGVSKSGALGPVWTPPAGGGPMITVHAMDVLIEGICFMGSTVGGTAIDCEWGGALYGENLTVRHCFFDEDVDTAIALEYAWNCHIYHNVFQECDAYGIYVDPAGSGIAYCRIHHNWFDDCAVAMELDEADDCEVAWNSLYNATAQGGGAAANVFINTAGGSENLVHHNTMSCANTGGGNGDYDDTNTAAATDAWIHNYLMNGVSVTNPT